MTTQKFIQQSGGQLQEATPNTTSAGAGDAGKLIALNGAGQLDVTMLPTGVGAETQVLVASEALSAGAWVNIWTSAGVAKARNADGSTSGKRAHGFVLQSVLSGGNATVYLAGINNSVTGATAGGDAFLSDTTPGGFVSTAPAGTGKTVQYLGPMLTTTAIAFEPTIPIVLA